MRKILVCLVAFFMLLGVWGFADGQALDVSVFKQGMVLNGVKVSNTALQYPLISYKDIVYMPLSTELGSMAGFTTAWNDAEKTLTVSKAPPKTPGQLSAKFTHQAKITANVSNIKLIINDKELNTGKYPILTYNYVTYVPISWQMANEVIGWQSGYHPYAGLILQTDGAKKIEDVVAEQNKKYYDGLASFMCTKNKGYNQENASKMMAIVKTAAEKHKLDEKWIMALWWKESTFNTGSVSSCGAVGAMQIMETTGKNYGYTRKQLLDPAISIDIGAQYIASLRAKYNGDLLKATIAYNQGSSRVDRGSYSSKFGTNVQGKYNEIKEYIDNYMAK